MEPNPAPQTDDSQQLLDAAALEAGDSEREAMAAAAREGDARLREAEQSAGGGDALSRAGADAPWTESSSRAETTAGDSDGLGADGR